MVNLWMVINKLEAMQRFIPLGLGKCKAQTAHAQLGMLAAQSASSDLPIQPELQWCQTNLLTVKSV